MDHQYGRLAKSAIRQHHAPFPELPQFPPFLQQGIPPMRVGRLLALAAVVVATSACYHQVIQTGRTPGTTVVDKPFAMSFIYGLVPVPDIDVSAQCRTGIATVVTEMSVVNGLVHIVTFGLVSPRHVTVTCAAGAGVRSGTEFYVAREASPEERNAVLAMAAEESARTQQPVVLRF